jgi:hypothetical protein
MGVISESREDFGDGKSDFSLPSRAIDDVVGG